MLNLPQSFNNIRDKLIKQQKELEKNLKKIRDRDPVHSDGLSESTEPGTDSWLADAHSKTQAVGENLMNLLQNTKQALQNIRKGSYGKCKKCGKQIEIARLEAMPTATLCLSCSRKSTK